MAWSFVRWCVGGLGVLFQNGPHHVVPFMFPLEAILSRLLQRRWSAANVVVVVVVVVLVVIIITANPTTLFQSFGQGNHVGLEETNLSVVPIACEGVERGSVPVVGSLEFPKQSLVPDIKGIPRLEGGRNIRRLQ